MIIKKLKAILSEYDLNQTQFYRAWGAGTLPLEALQKYGNEYGNFIGQLSLGWETLGEYEQAKVEDEHYEIWKNDFCNALHVQISAATLPEVQSLIDSAENMFSQKNEALGALYIFIAQQASTSASKIDGLRKYYALDSLSESYFEKHLNSDILGDKLLTIIDKLSSDDQKEVIRAADIFAQKLFQALEGIHKKYQIIEHCKS